MCKNHPTHQRVLPTLLRNGNHARTLSRFVPGLLAPQHFRTDRLGQSAASAVALPDAVWCHSPCKIRCLVTAKQNLRAHPPRSSGKWFCCPRHRLAYVASIAIDCARHSEPEMVRHGAKNSDVTSLGDSMLTDGSGLPTRRTPAPLTAHGDIRVSGISFSSRQFGVRRNGCAGIRQDDSDMSNSLSNPRVLMWHRRCTTGCLMCID